jgi:hypothetical protein
MYLEVEECCVFSWCCLDRFETNLVPGDSDADMLESSGAVEEFGWLRKCYHHPGAIVADAGGDRTDAEMECSRGCA